MSVYYFALVKLANKLNAHAWHSPSGMEFLFDLVESIRISDCVIDIRRWNFSSSVSSLLVFPLSLYLSLSLSSFLFFSVFLFLSLSLCTFFARWQSSDALDHTISTTRITEKKKNEEVNNAYIVLNKTHNE